MAESYQTCNLSPWQGIQAHGRATFVFALARRISQPSTGSTAPLRRRLSSVSQQRQSITDVNSCNVRILPPPSYEGLFHKSMALHLICGTTPSQGVRSEAERGKIQPSDSPAKEIAKGAATLVPAGNLPETKLGL